MADIPGLIEGAGTGKGLGDLFLGHIERCSVLLHLVDGTGADVAADYKVVLNELGAYGAGLTGKPRVTVLNKTDALDGEVWAAKLATLAKVADGPVMAMSGVSHDGLTDVLRALRAPIDAGRLRRHDEQMAGVPWHP